MIFLNPMERDNYMKTVTAMCEQLAKKVAEYENKPIETVLSDAYLDSGRDIWHESFNAVVRNLTGNCDDK